MGTQTGILNPSQSVSVSNGNERVLPHSPQSSDGLVQDAHYLFAEAPHRCGK